MSAKTPTTSGISVAAVAQAALEKAVLVERILEENAAIFTEAFETQDAAIYVLQKAFHDLISGELQTVEHDGIKRVNFSWYFGYYVACMGMAAFASKIPVEVSSTKGAEDPYAGAFVFGGDVGQ